VIEWKAIARRPLLCEFSLQTPQNSELIRFGFLAKKTNLISSVMKMFHICHQLDNTPRLFPGRNGKAVRGLHPLPRSSRHVVIDALVQLCGKIPLIWPQMTKVHDTEVFERRNSPVQKIVSVRTLLPFSSLSVYHGKRKTGWTK
jgi:hypothetical protein